MVDGCTWDTSENAAIVSYVRVSSPTGGFLMAGSNTSGTTVSWSGSESQVDGSGGTRYCVVSSNGEGGGIVTYKDQQVFGKTLLFGIQTTT